MKIRVVSDGTLDGTRIEDAETGELVEGIVAVEWDWNCPEGPVVRLEIIRPEVDLVGELRRFQVEKL